jgi:folate-binding protein YgfZ
MNARHDAIRSTALRLEGGDALDLLHRISTNALLDLAPGRARGTLFCDFRGRLLHRAVVARASDGAVWLLRDDAPPAPLAAHIDRHLFREDVRIADRSAAWSVHPAEDGPAPGSIEERDGVPVRVAPEDGFALALESRATTPDVDPDAYTRARVQAGRPAHGHEIVDTFHPFEVRLAHEVHLDKGCFTGQEVLLRLVTRDAVRRRLARVAGAGAVPALPSRLFAGGEEAGALTTVIADGSGWMGLAVLKRAALEPGVTLTTEDARAVDSVFAMPAGEPLGRP